MPEDGQIFGMPYSMIFLESEARVKISIARKDKEQNKRFYGLLNKESLKRLSLDLNFGGLDGII